MRTNLSDAAGWRRRTIRIAAAGVVLWIAGGAPMSANASGVAPATVYYCHGYGCAFRPPVRLSSGDMATLRKIMSGGQGSAVAERAAIGRANQWFERKAGAQTGTSNDGAKDVYDLFTPPSQIDCVDEANNATALLKLIESRGWMKFHKVGRIDRRGFLIDGRYPHHTATIREQQSGKVWVVDSWVRANAEPPDIKPLDVWKKEGGLRG